MKLLFDNNLSHKLVSRLGDIFQGSTHVMLENLDESGDNEIWKFAKNNGFIIVTKDADFNELSLMQGFPPKIIWLRIGNCKIQDIEKLIRDTAITLSEFYHDDSSGIIEIK